MEAILTTGRIPDTHGSQKPYAPHGSAASHGLAAEGAHQNDGAAVPCGLQEGIHNWDVDSLSRRPFDADQVFTVTEVQPAWLQQVAKSYDRDATAQLLLQKLYVDIHAFIDHTLSAGIIRCKNRILVGTDPELRNQIIAAFPDSPMGVTPAFQ